MPLIQSTDIADLADALRGAQSEFPNIPKKHNADTGKFGYSYADLADTVAAVRPILGEHGLVVSQMPSTSDDGAPALVTLLMHTSGQYIGAEMPLVGAEVSAQALGSSVTYGRRYALGAILGLVTEDDDDGGSATHPQGHSQSRPAPVPARPVQAAAPVQAVRAVAEAFPGATESGEPFFDEDGKPIQTTTAAPAAPVVERIDGPRQVGASEKQIGAIQSMYRKSGLGGDIHTWAGQMLGIPKPGSLYELSGGRGGQASELFEALKELLDAAA